MLQWERPAWAPDKKGSQSSLPGADVPSVCRSINSKSKYCQVGALTFPTKINFNLRVCTSKELLDFLEELRDI